ncbi:unnamed protein product [Rangifer tarandus platyrhynchus]|uniref:Uncharacterized protein n=1 Tax=Rangifer tarandus platyrhynchus TaxID=3082113 RepID=A0ABN8ZR00_RANTA|nr:unnamed protein product [Rangifer tarandus platyrhynchus]
MGGHALTRTRPCPEDPVRSSLPRGSGGGLAVRMPRPRAEAMGSLRVMAGVPHHALVIPARVSAHWLLLPPVLRALEQALPVLTPGPRTLRGGHCGPAGTRWPFGWNLGPEADLRPPLREPRTQVGSLGVLLGAGLACRNLTSSKEHTLIAASQGPFESLSPFFSCVLSHGLVCVRSQEDCHASCVPGAEESGCSRQDYFKMRLRGLGAHARGGSPLRWWFVPSCALATASRLSCQACPEVLTGAKWKVRL